MAEDSSPSRIAYLTRALPSFLCKETGRGAARQRLPRSDSLWRATIVVVNDLSEVVEGAIATAVFDFLRTLPLVNWPSG